MSELEYKPIPNIVNVNDIQNIIETNKIIEQENIRLHSIIKEAREMLQKKVDFHKNLDFYEDKELETQVYLNYVACLQDFDEIVERYKVEE